ncbi:MAG: redoxin domain-containing protein, partial [Frankia sp.]|nr:redoxin domain-containing protein [Frankia sp.]
RRPRPRSPGRAPAPQAGPLLENDRPRRARLAAAGLALAGLLLLLLGATGCAGTGERRGDGPPPGATGVPDELVFEAPTTDGGTLAGPTLVGTPVVLWFWAPWCPICRGEAPEIARALDRYGTQVRFVGVAGLGTVEEVQAFITETGLTGFPHLIDVDGRLWAGFGVTQQPALAFVTADGTVDTFQGRMSELELNHYLGKLVGEV